jgi:hypothetical protein
MPASNHAMENGANPQEGEQRERPSDSESAARKEGVQILRLRLSGPKVTPTGGGTPSLKNSRRRTASQLEADRERKRQKRRELAEVAAPQAESEPEPEPEAELNPELSAAAQPEDRFNGFLDSAQADIGNRNPGEGDRRRFERARNLAEVCISPVFVVFGYS